MKADLLESAAKLLEAGVAPKNVLNFVYDSGVMDGLKQTLSMIDKHFPEPERTSAYVCKELERDPDWVSRGVDRMREKEAGCFDPE
jgi:hypothetical protein